MQTIPFETDDLSMTVAAALQALNSDPDLRDADGNPVSPIVWDCGCMQAKCGACAMRINGVPRLACDARMSEFAKKGSATLEPLRKFPVVADLAVDRSVMRAQLTEMRLWMTDSARTDGEEQALTYDAARCLQCGCCLEVCPNYCAGGDFGGTAALVPAARLMTVLPQEAQAEIVRAHRDHFYEGCGKSLACRDICPAGIDVERLLVRANAAMRRKRRRSK